MIIPPREQLAFPFEFKDDEKPSMQCFGMTMRQFYKGMALQGILACEICTGTVEELVEQAAKYADAMLAEDAKHLEATP